MNDTVKLMIPQAEHPLAGQTMTGAAMVVQAIADEGVSAIFGYSGGAVLPTYDAVFLYNEVQTKAGRRQLPLIVPANEQAAGFMAAGYSRSTGQVGVALVTSGPGATNMVTPVRDCMADSIPMVVICGQVSRAAIGSDAFQEAPIASGADTARVDEPFGIGVGRIVAHEPQHEDLVRGARRRPAPCVRIRRR